MLRRTMFALALVAGLLAAGLAAPVPAAAAQTALVHCQVRGGGGFPPGPGYNYWIDAYATYDPVPGNPFFRTWTGYRFRLDGAGPPGDQSNVNIRLYDGDALIFEWNSPDNIHPRIWYDVRAASTTTTFAVDDVVWFEAIFDRARRGDPNCTTKTPPV